MIRAGNLSVVSQWGRGADRPVLRLTWQSWLAYDSHGHPQPGYDIFATTQVEHPSEITEVDHLPVAGL